MTQRGLAVKFDPKLTGSKVWHKNGLVVKFNENGLVLKIDSKWTGCKVWLKVD